MFTTVLVPLDGSPLADRALPYAAALAKAEGNQLLLVRALSSAESQHEAEADLTAVADRLSSSGLVVDVVVRRGDAAWVITETARAQSRCLIVMSTHGRSGIGRWIYGSVADQVLRQADVPVVLVPPTCDRAWKTDGPLRILAPLDGSDLAEEALTVISDLAARSRAELILLRVVEPPTYAFADAYPSPLYEPEADAAEAERYLNDVASAIRPKSDAVKTRIAVGFPAATIAATAGEENADLIAMATHASGGLTRLVMGSVATGTLQRANVPLMLLRPTAIAQQSLEPGVLLGLDDLPPPDRAESISLAPRDRDLLWRGLEALLAGGSIDEQTRRDVDRLRAALRRSEAATPARRPPNGHARRAR